VALAAARDTGIDVRPGAGLPIVALAKERDTTAPAQAPRAPGTDEKPAAVVPAGPQPDRVFLPQAKDAIPIRANSAEMFVLQRLRDEAHRFAVTFHRSQRKKRTIQSELSRVPGIGPARQRELLRHFGSLKKVREASLADLLAAPGITRKTASALRDYFAAHG
jgi:excinuclease ABC subunit C